MPKRPTTVAELCDDRDAMKLAEEDAEMGEFEDPFEDELEEEELVDENEEDEEEDEEEEGEVAVFRPGVDQLEADEELVPAEGAYKFLHKLELDWPCLTFDFLDTATDVEMRYPLDVTVVAATQADRTVSSDKLYVTRWSNLRRNHDAEDEDEDEDDASSSSSEEEDEEEGGDGVLRFRQIPIEGGASNRVRAMPQMRSIVSVFGEDGKVRVFNVQRALDEVQAATGGMGGVVNLNPVYQSGSSNHETEGYGLAWNPVSLGHMVTGDDQGRLNLWLPAAGGTWDVTQLRASGRGVLDVAWKDANVFATGHVGGKVELWDARSRAAAAATGVEEKKSGGVDVNAVAWNPKVGELLLTGSDDGSFKIYDARNTAVHLAHFHWHKEQITSVAWHPTDETTLLVASADDSISFWDMSVEADDENDDDADNNKNSNGGPEYPAQLLFLHQGQQWIKEAKFCSKYSDAVVSTAGDGFNFFRTCNI